MKISNKLVSNSNNLIPVILSLLWSLLVIFEFFTTVPILNKTNKLEGSGMFIIGLLMLSSIMFLFTFLWILISNVINKVKFYIDIQYSFMILIIWLLWFLSVNILKHK
jgi:hypothetical protein